MKKIFSVLFFATFFFACNNGMTKEERLNFNNLSKYLKNTFDIDIASLNTKLVLINNLGCKACVNKHLDVFSNSKNNNNQSFTFIVSMSMINKFNQNCTLDSNYPLYVDSNNILLKQNIIIEGLSIYHINNGNLVSIKTVNINETNDIDLKNFWFE